MEHGLNIVKTKNMLKVISVCVYITSKMAGILFGIKVKAKVVFIHNLIIYFI